jgi:hypothetical protein
MVKARLVLFIISLIILQENLNGQNLIQDPGFEAVEFVFDGEDTVYQYTHWISLLPFKKHAGSLLIPRYSKIKKRILNNSHLHYWEPFEGDSYLHPGVVYHRNLYQTKLLKPLIPGEKYKISFKYKVLADGYSSSKIESAINKKIGVSFSINDICTPEMIEKFSERTYKFSPQYGLSNFHGDSLWTWQNFEFVFEADKAYQFLHAGNFTRIIESSELGYNPPSGISYRMDLLELIPVDKNTALTLIIDQDSAVDISKHTEMFSNLTSFKIENPDLLKYYSLVSEAENDILNNNIDSAIMLYERAFRTKAPFFRDFRNAQTVLKSAGQSDSSIVKLVRHKSKDGPSQNKILVQKIDSIFQLDLLARNNNFQIGKQDSANHLIVFTLLSQYDLSESTIGINGLMQLDLLLLHLARYEHFSELLVPLRKQVQNGHFDVRPYANLIDHYFEFHFSHSKIESIYLTSAMFPIFTKFLYPDIRADVMRKLNDRRSVIGLERIENQYKKQFYNFKNGYKGYEFYQYFSYYPAEDQCTEEEKMKYIEGEKKLITEFEEKYGTLLIWSK